MGDDRDWRETAHLRRPNWPEAIPNCGPKREYGPYPWGSPSHPGLDERDTYPASHPDAASIGTKFMGDVCPRCGVPMRHDETVVGALGNRGELADVAETPELFPPSPAFHPECWAKRRAHNLRPLSEFMSGGGDG